MRDQKAKNVIPPNMNNQIVVKLIITIFHMPIIVFSSYSAVINCTVIWFLLLLLPIRGLSDGF